MTEEIRMIGEATARIFADLADPQTVNAATDDAWTGTLWQALSEARLTSAWDADAGMSPELGFEILRISGHYACPAALAETMLARWALGGAGIDAPDGILTVAPVRSRDSISISSTGASGRARSVPHGAQAAHVLVADGAQIALVAAQDITSQPRETDMGGARADLTFDTAPAITATLPEGAAGLQRMGAVARACQMAGALESALALTTDYTGEREAFGRKISKFQAVQQSLARLAGEVAAALTASGSAAETLATHDLGSDAAFFEVAAAKIRVGEAVETGAAIAHQAHGAIGWTQDYVLQRYTRRMFGWRDDFGAEADWATRLGTYVAGRGADGVWPLLTTR